MQGHFTVVLFINVRVSVAAIHQHDSVNLHSGRFTALNKADGWKRNAQSVLIMKSVYQPMLDA